MENLIKQMRWKFPGEREDNKEEAEENIRERKIPLQKTQSFKGVSAEKKKGQNWLRRQFSGEMSRGFDLMDGGEYPTAVAAATFAITSIGELQTPVPDNTREGPTTTLTKVNSKGEDGTAPAMQSQSVSKRFKGTNLEVPGKRVSFRIGDDYKMPTEVIPPAATNVKQTTTLADKLSQNEYEVTGKPVGLASSIKKKGTFAEQLDRTSSRKPETAILKPDKLPKFEPIPVPKPDRMPTILPAEIARESSTQPREGGSKADNWQRSEMAKIQERYQKLNTKILHWENKKKTKAKNKMATIEGELEKKRARAQQHYSDKVKTIEQVAGRARAQAEKNRRSDEFKAKEKANRIRSTGKVPSTCFCF